MRFILISLAMFASLLLCAGAPPLPEALISSKNHELIKSKLIARMLAKGASLETDSPHQLTFTKPTDGIFATLAVGDQPFFRYKYTLVDESAGVRVYASGEVTSANRSYAVGDRNTIIPLTKKKYLAVLQLILDDVKQTVEAEEKAEARVAAPASIPLQPAPSPVASDPAPTRPTTS